jgi:phosphatidate cytidylyltransferase
LLLTRVITAAVLIAALLAALFLFERVVLQALVTAIVIGAAYEWCRLSGFRSLFQILAFSLTCAIGVWGFLLAPLAIPYALGVAVLFWAVIAPLWLSRGLLPGPKQLLPLAAYAVIVPAGVAMATLEPALLLVLIGISVVADTAAYFCGRAFGRRKLAPKISPGKTWEGAVGGAVFCLIYATICAMLMPQIGSRVEGAGWGLYLFGVMVLCAASILGDLLESALKRRAGAKDSGRLLPGHGGVLDRIDSATATLPLGFLMLRGAGIA